LHILEHVMAHQVKAEAVHFVLRCPGDNRVDHQLAHHGMFGRRVLAARGRFHCAVGIQAMIVTGHDAVQHRVLILSARIGMVVNHVHHYAQPALVEGLHHVTEFQDAGRSIWIRGITPFGGGVMQRIIAPVETI
jgi:hypothetical protein